MGNRSSRARSKSGAAAGGSPRASASKQRPSRYKDTSWDLRVVKQMIMDKELAPLHDGVDDEPPTSEGSPEVEECPVCFLYFATGVNRTRCCQTIM